MEVSKSQNPWRERVNINTPYHLLSFPTGRLLTGIFETPSFSKKHVCKQFVSYEMRGDGTGDSPWEAVDRVSGMTWELLEGQ